MKRRGGSSRGIVFFSAQDYWYHNRAHSDFQLTKGLALERTVVLVNSIGMRMPTPGGTTQPLRRVLRKARSIARAVRRPEAGLPNLVVMSPVILPLYGSAAGRRANAVLVSAQVRVVLWWLGVRRPDVVVTIPTAADVVDRLPHASLTVNRSDKFSAFTEANQPVIAALEKRLLAAADTVVYVSHTLLEEERSSVSGTPYFLGHGLDVEHFTVPDDAPAPDDLAGIAHPVVGFFGGIDDYVVDLDLLRRTAESMTEGTLLLIGDATCDISELASHPRVLWLGPRDYSQIPSYGAAFDVAIMPWLDNDWIRYCNPIKAKEYLALGRPIVTTYYPEVEPFDQVMGVAKSPDEFVALVHEATQTGGEGTPQTRRAAVAGDTWLARSQELLQLIDSAAR
jgi:glycosyltransferase involved in cell wall biosynthesis